MKGKFFFSCLVFAYVALVFPYTDYLKNRPIQIKLGYMPHPQLLKAVSGEHAPTTAAMAVLRVLFYYGTILQEFQEDNQVHPEFYNMYKTLQGAAYVDPYNMDTYYFAQAAFTWGLGRIDEVNHLLESGMKYRTWDYSLPFYIGFNSAYFQKDYAKAAVYMKRAAEISGNPTYAKLAARYFYESEQVDLGLSFLETMISGAKDQSVRRTYELRRGALLAVRKIESAISSYTEKFGARPQNLSQLISSRVLETLPSDPYGGEFYLAQDGTVRSTSKFANPVIEN